MLRRVDLYVVTDVSKGCSTSSNTTNPKRQYLAFLKCIYPWTALSVQVVFSQPPVRNDRVVTGMGFCVCVMYTRLCVRARSRVCNGL